MKINEQHGKRKRNIEIIDGVVIDWDKFKVNKGVSRFNSSVRSYIDLCKLIHKNGHKLIGDYTGCSGKTFIDYNCGHEPYHVIISAYKRGNKCPMCAKDERRVENNDAFLKILKKEHKLITPYVNEVTKVLIDFGCNHGKTWITPHQYKKKPGCLECGRERRVEHNNKIRELSMKKVEVARGKFIELLNKDGYELMTEYTNSYTKVLIDFKCGHEPQWVYPTNYKTRPYCKVCNNIKNKEICKEELLEILEINNHKLLSEYVDTRTKVLIDLGGKTCWVTPSTYKSNNISVLYR